ncbi:hypothetical protein MMC18_000907 [Xylographa bjoerkii]|nr:hypothetical protein [Xylographa bjoerkii]
MPENKESGRRLIVSLIDSIAIEDPGRAWASVPIDDSDLSKGFKDISYKELAIAINHSAHWLQEHITDNVRGEFETLAYAGPKDLRYPILAVAAVKCGKKLLLVSPFATAEAQMHLLSVTNCTTYLHAATLEPLIHSICDKHPHVQPLKIPELHEWLFQNEGRPFPYHKTWEQAKLDPWIIFHTSGTTGLPKPIVYTNLMMTSFDAAELMPDADEETMNDQFRNSRCYTPLPTLHFVGMTAALQWTVFFNMTLIVGPPTLATAAQVTQVLELGNADGAAMPPSLIEDMLRDPKGLTRMQKLKYVYFIGAPLPRHVAEKLVGHIKVLPGMGSTEAGAYFTKVRNEDDWDYYCFRPSMGVELEQRAGDLYELVFRRKPELERWQQLFQVYPDLDVFPTKDLWTKHPTRPDLWRYAGRTDDLVIFSHGEDLWVADVETEIQRHPDVRFALIGGQGRPRPFLIIELVCNDLMSESEKESKLDAIWPQIEKANAKCSEYVKMNRRDIIFTDPARPFVRTAKDTISRTPSLSLYSAEIDKLYST